MKTAATLRSCGRFLALERRSIPFQTASTVRCINTQQLPPVLTPPSPPLPLVQPPQKGFFAKILDRYSPRSQKDRNYQSEVLFQAATQQAADPYVQISLNCLPCGALFGCLFSSFPHNIYFPLTKLAVAGLVQGILAVISGPVMLS
jgi:hypothetical protein